MHARDSAATVGIDFGGTTVKAGLVSADGRVLDRLRADTAAVRRPDAWLAFAGQCLERFAGAGRRLDGIGVGVPGFVDFERGYIHNLTNVPGWTGIPLADRLRRRFGLPTRVDNDVNAMAVGECAHGAGRGLRDAVFATLGTGVGGAIVIDGRLYRGAYSMAGELGHVTIDRHGRRTPEGRGGLETYVGNRRLAAAAAHALRAGRASLLAELANGDPRRITPALIARAARRGDALARALFDDLADCLAAAFASVTYLLQPEAIIVGGGMARSGRVLFGPLRRHLRERLHPLFAARLRILPAALGEDAGLIGAAVLARPEGAAHVRSTGRRDSDRVAPPGAPVRAGRPFNHVPGRGP